MDRESDTTKRGLLPIGKMAKANSVSIGTLRLYDQLGLLSPAYIDEQSGYRYYDIRQSARLDIIRYMRELDMTLADISTLLEKEDLTLIEDMLIRKNEQIYSQMRELKAMQDAVNRTIHSIERYRISPASGTISLEFIDRRFILSMPCRDNFYEHGIVSYEQNIHILRSKLLEKGIPQLLSYNLGTSVKNEDFTAGRFIADQIFIFGDKHLRDYGENVSILESGMYACIYLDNFDDEIPFAHKLMEYCRKQNFQMEGDYICEEMTEFNFFDNRQRNMFLRLQVQVSFPKNNP
ncbi:MAG: MerR family transcriptional regulator [Oscillospiraceae bacterium]|nr:MerR family transcriptional regulator [Oscillospiraceae bacterium]